MSSSRKYIFEFTSWRNGVDVPARVEIYDRAWTGQYSTVDVIGMADPVVLTWDKAELTDCLQGAQLAVNLLAQSDGQYRDILYMNSPTAVLYISGSVFWRGNLATRTWIEPFVRDKDYDVTITFSDFNYLDRLHFDKGRMLDYTSDFPAGSHPGDCGVVKLGDFLDYAVAELGITDPDIDYGAGLPLNGFGSAIADYLIHYTSFDNNGDPLTLKQCLEAVLEPLCCRCVQYGGKLRIYRIDAMPASFAGSIISGGTDATLESATQYRNIIISYDQSWHGMTSDEPDSSDVKLGDPYCQAGSVRLFAGDRYEQGKTGVKAMSLLWGEKAEEFLLAVANGAWTVPSGKTTPAVDSEISWGDIAHEDYAPIKVSFDMCQGYSAKTASGVYPSGYGSVTLRFHALVSTTNFPYDDNPIDSGIRYIHYRARVAAYSDLLQPRYLVSELNTPVPTSGWENTDGWFRIALSVAGTPDFFSTGGWREVSEAIPLPPGYTRVTVVLYPVPLAINNNGSVDSDAAPLRYSAVRDLMIDAGDNVDETLIGSTNTRNMDYGRDGENFEKTFTFGIPEVLTPFTDSAYRAGSVESSGGDTLLDRWRVMLARNYSSDYTCRYIVKGTYRYPHTVPSSPVFPVSGIFQSIAEDGAFFLMRSESWHVRSGDSELELEPVRTSGDVPEPPVPFEQQLYKVTTTPPDAPAAGGIIVFQFKSNCTSLQFSTCWGFPAVSLTIGSQQYDVPSDSGLSFEVDNIVEGGGDTVYQGGLIVSIPKRPDGVYDSSVMTIMSGDGTLMIQWTVKWDNAQGWRLYGTGASTTALPVTGGTLTYLFESNCKSLTFQPPWGRPVTRLEMDGKSYLSSVSSSAKFTVSDIEGGGEGNEVYEGHIEIDCNFDLTEEEDGKFIITSPDDSSLKQEWTVGINKPVTLTVIPASGTINSLGEGIYFTVETNADDWDVSHPAVSWLNVYKDTASRIYVTAYNNEGRDAQERSASFTVTAGDKSIIVPVTQEAVGELQLWVNSSGNMPPQGGEHTIQISTNAQGVNISTLNASSAVTSAKLYYAEDSELHLIAEDTSVPIIGALFDGTVNIPGDPGAEQAVALVLLMTFAATSSDEDVSVRISIVATMDGAATDTRETLDITQYGNAFGIFVDPTNVSLPKEGGSIVVYVDADMSWEASRSKTFFSVSPASGGAGRTAVTVNAYSANTSGENKTGYLYFSGRNEGYPYQAVLTVIQLAEEQPYLVINPSVLYFDGYGNSDSGNILSVNSNTRWEIERDDFISTSPAMATGSKDVRVTVKSSATTRQGTITVRTMDGTIVQTCIVKQTGSGVAEITFDPSSLVIDYLGSIKQVMVDSSIGSWSVVSYPDWVKVSGISTNFFYVNANDNTGRNDVELNDTITVQSGSIVGTLPVKQEAAGLYLNTMDEWPVTKEGETLQMMIYTNMRSFSFVFLGRNTYNMKQIVIAQNEEEPKLLLQTSEANITNLNIPGDPGADTMFALGLVIEIPKNTTGQEVRDQINIRGFIGDDNSGEYVEKIIVIVQEA